MKAYNILWDIDEEETTDRPTGLPDEVELPSSLTDEEEISDYLSDTYGFCHKGFLVQ